MELRDRPDTYFRGLGIPRGAPVKTPPAHEGVGNALRHSYTPHVDQIPDDMMQLLAKLK